MARDTLLLAVVPALALAALLGGAADASGRYRLEARLPPAPEWGIYLRYGLAQAGYAGTGRIRLAEAGGVATTAISLRSGFAGDVPAYVQPLGFLVFGLIAAVTLLGLRALLQVIRAAQGQSAGRLS